MSAERVVLGQNFVSFRGSFVSDIHRRSHPTYGILFNFIIVNQGSRNFEGRVLVKRDSRSTGQLPVLVLTEYLDMSCYLEALQLGAADYVEKPLRADEVARLVETHVRRREHERIVTGDNLTSL